MQVSLDADGDGTPDFDGEGELSIGNVTKIDQIRVHIVRASENVNVHVGQILLSHGEISVDPIEIDGLGDPIEASFHSSLGAAHVQVKGEGVRSRALRSRVEGAEGLSGCIASIDVDVTVRRDGGDGRVGLELGRCSLGPVEGVSLGMNAVLRGARIAGRAHAEIDDVGNIVLTSPAITIGGTGSFLESWKQAFGRVKFEGKIDLQKLRARLPRGALPLDHLHGVITVQGRVERDSPTDDTPGLNLSATTAGLAIIGPSSRTTGLDGKAVISPPAWSVDGDRPRDRRPDRRRQRLRGGGRTAERRERGAHRARLQVGGRPLRRDARQTVARARAPRDGPVQRPRGVPPARHEVSPRRSSR